MRGGTLAARAAKQSGDGGRASVSVWRAIVSVSRLCNYGMYIYLPASARVCRAVSAVGLWTFIVGSARHCVGDVPRCSCSSRFGDLAELSVAAMPGPRSCSVRAEGGTHAWRSRMHALCTAWSSGEIDRWGGMVVRPSPFAALSHRHGARAARSGCCPPCACLVITSAFAWCMRAACAKSRRRAHLRMLSACLHAQLGSPAYASWVRAVV